MPTLQEPRGYNFDVDADYFARVVWPMPAHRFPQFQRTRCLNTLAGLYDQNDLDGNVIIGPGCGRAMDELLLTGRYQTIDLTRLG